MIEVNDVKFSYSKHQPPVFDHFSIRFESGKIYGLLGKNGSGKSTLLYLLAGLLKPAEGRVLYKGNDAARRRPSFLGDTFIVPEVFDTPDRTIVAHARELSRFYPCTTLRTISSSTSTGRAAFLPWTISPTGSRCWTNCSACGFIMRNTGPSSCGSPPGTRKSR